MRNKTDHHKRSIAKTAILQVQKLLEGTLSLRDHNAQISKPTP
ncbi:hypothetical protein [Candidatus Enterovibrio altilux]|nr:hypothetical protein [Candidatus Enterovibrio luxaltus]